ncbi:MoxR-like ATPase [Acetitomaculum ruminis DSM 5522]|uniref:MoxR-like ATPase n=1 Tax=Acetitomaculum ruminis DSM 5522 TaxID=1120918 RepID=A0A1I0W6N7_9FIRM|nr:MoxR family ATPase [Acetitomaculum ruminis]SFA84439.1 MoxR-like ATPase [Acetitomaculum ruminis DSM 5522]
MQKTDELINEIKKVVIGKEQVIKKVIMAMLAGGHVLLEDIPGVGKTTMALSISRCLGLDYKRIQFTPDVIPSDVVGFTVLDRKSGEFVYKPGVVMTNLLLADEINRTSSKTQAALLEVMEEGHVTVDGHTYEVPKPFTVISTQNPFGSAGTQMLPQSQMDRFMVRLEMGYPDFESQISILRDRQTEKPLELVKQVVDKNELEVMQNEVRFVTVKDGILEYITKLVENTRVNEYVKLGVSPRGAYALNNMAKACAYVEGRDYVTPEDVMEVFPYVTSHRVILHPKAKVAELSAIEIMSDIVKNTEVPAIV